MFYENDCKQKESNMLEIKKMFSASLLTAGLCPTKTPMLPPLFHSSDKGHDCKKKAPTPQFQIRNQSCNNGGLLQTLCKTIEFLENQWYLFHKLLFSVS